MTKNDWIKVIEAYFKEVSLIENGNLLTIENDKHTVCFPVPPNGKVFSVEGADEIVIATKDIIDHNSSDRYYGEYLIFQPELETCILVAHWGIRFIPWHEITIVGMNNKRENNS